MIVPVAGEGGNPAYILLAEFWGQTQGLPPPQLGKESVAVPFPEGSQQLKAVTPARRCYKLP